MQRFNLHPLYVHTATSTSFIGVEHIGVTHRSLLYRCHDEILIAYLSHDEHNVDLLREHTSQRYEADGDACAGDEVDVCEAVAGVEKEREEYHPYCTCYVHGYPRVLGLVEVLGEVPRLERVCCA